MSVHQGTLVDAAWPEGTAGANALRAVALIIFGSLLMTVGAKVQVPFYPVPTTMQTFSLMLIIATFGGRLAFGAVGVYLAQGFVGVPVFAYAAAGPAYFAGTTGGYLVGFLVAAAVGGWLMEKWGGRGVLRTGAVLLISLVIVFACGLTWLSTLIGVPAAFQYGFAHVILGDIVKLALTVAVVAAGWQVVSQR